MPQPIPMAVNVTRLSSRGRIKRKSYKASGPAGRRRGTHVADRFAEREPRNEHGLPGADLATLAARRTTASARRLRPRAVTQFPRRPLTFGAIDPRAAASLRDPT